ncbi:hypothetical protein MMC18_008965 [Xylographa bjoerkii]|nr:hypothetical protein [Xylographa bjoerkii]
MAAASYYQGAPAQPGPYEMPAQSPAPPSKQPQQYTSSIYSDGPPPYSPGPAMAQIPRQQQPSQQRPLQQGSNSYYASQPTPYPPPPPQQYPQTPAARQQYQPYQQYQPQPNSAPYPQHQYLQPQPYPPAGVYPPIHKQQSPGYQRRYSEDAGYRSDPEYERRHHSRPHKRRPHSRDERSKGSSKGSDHNGILGATGGALLGDLIFPGLGTTVVGGLAGWYAGKKVDKADKGTSYEQKQRRKH